MEEHERVWERLGGVADPLRFLVDMFSRAPYGMLIYRADGRVLVTNDAVSQIKNLANLRDRNAEWGEQAVREAVNISAMALPRKESEFDRAGITLVVPTPCSQGSAYAKFTRTAVAATIRTLQCSRYDRIRGATGETSHAQVAWRAHGRARIRRGRARPGT